MRSTDLFLLTALAVVVWRGTTTTTTTHRITAFHPEHSHRLLQGDAGVRGVQGTRADLRPHGPREGQGAPRQVSCRDSQSALLTLSQCSGAGRVQDQSRNFRGSSEEDFPPAVWVQDPGREAGYLISAGMDSIHHQRMLWREGMGKAVSA